MNIHVIQNIISEKNAGEVIDFINSGDKFFNYGINNDIRHLRFGKDIHFKEDDITILPAHIKEIIIDLADKITTSAKTIFSVNQSYLTQFWLVKRLPGNIHGLHDDYEYGDEHLQYGGVVYLNSWQGGEIYFPKVNFSYSPNGRDMILFDSHDKMYTHGVKKVLSDRYSIAYWTTSDKKFELKI